jgi:aspartyl/asparaginyl-tRNA synthetase
MIEPEIAFADFSDNAALAEALLKYTFAALLNDRQEALAFCDQRIEGAGHETRGDRRLRIRAYGLRRGNPGA